MTAPLGAAISAFFTRLMLAMVAWTRFLPLSWVRALGALLGWLLYWLVAGRRRVVQTNLRLCFPHMPEAERKALAKKVFMYFAQAWLDRGWLWHGSGKQVLSRLRLTGAVKELMDDRPTVIFAPHFVGLDAAWTALTQQLTRKFVTIYSAQVNPVSDAWILAGRKRFGRPELVARLAGIKPLVSALREGHPLYLLPDMNFDPRESVFVPFYGVPAATVPSLSRFAKLGRAKVVPVVARMCDSGYEVEVMPAWEGFPTEDSTADTLLMNQRLEQFIATMPAQYYWVHKRFKDRPDNGPAPY